MAAGPDRVQEGGRAPARGEHAPAMGTVGLWTRPALRVGLCSRQRGWGRSPEAGAEREIAGGSAESHGKGMPSRAKEWALLGLGVKVGLWFMGPRDERGLGRWELGGIVCVRPQRGGGGGGNRHPRARVFIGEWWWVRKGWAIVSQGQV